VESNSKTRNPDDIPNPKNPHSKSTPIRKNKRSNTLNPKI
jgi:hypothetical protein